MKLLDYIRGARKGKEAHRIEYDAMSDPFLADAIEGFDSVEGNHADRIAQMQARITTRAAKQKKRSGAWRIAVAAIAFIAAISGYFTLMNHESSMVVAGCDNCFIDIYAPEDYIERKRLELTLEQEQNPDKDVAATAIVNIENLEEILKPIEPIRIYLPGNYAQMQKDDMDELRVIESHYRKVQEREESLEHTAEIEVEKNQPILASEPVITVLEEETISVNEVLKDKVAGVSVLNTEQHNTTTLARHRVSGKIVDETGEPIIGATVAVKGSNKGTVTDLDGNYVLDTDSEAAKLIASYIGYESVEIPDLSQAKVVAMKPSNSNLDEVVIVAHGKVAKNEISGSVSQVASMDKRNDSHRFKIEQKTKPKPIIGENAYKDYLKENAISSTDGECAGKKGKVVLEFTIDSNGRPQNIKIIKSVCSDIDNKAIHLVQSGSDWTQGTEKIKLDIQFK